MEAKEINNNDNTSMLTIESLQNLLEYFNNASLDSKKSEIIKDLQKVASSCDYAKKEGQYRIWWF